MVKNKDGLRVVIIGAGMSGILSLRRGPGHSSAFVKRCEHQNLATPNSSLDAKRLHHMIDANSSKGLLDGNEP